MTESRRRIRVLLRALAAGAGLALEGAAILRGVAWLWPSGAVLAASWDEALVLHLAGCFVSSLAKAGRSPVSAFLLAMLLPPFGAFAAAIDLAAGGLAPESARSTWYREFLELTKSTLAETRSGALAGRASVDPEVRAPDSLALAPVVSLLNDPFLPAAMKLAAVRNLTHLEAVDAVPLLERALASPEPAIRYYAAKLLTNLEDAFSRRLREAESDRARARVRLEMADTGLLDAGAARRHREQAVEELKPLTDRHPRETLELARAELHLGRAADARETVRSLVGPGPDGARAYRLSLEACLELSDYVRFRELAAECGRTHPEVPWAKELGERTAP